MCVFDIGGVPGNLSSGTLSCLSSQSGLASTGQPWGLALKKEGAVHRAVKTGVLPTHPDFRTLLTNEEKAVLEMSQNGNNSVDIGLKLISFSLDEMSGCGDKGR